MFSLWLGGMVCENTCSVYNDLLLVTEVNKDVFIKHLINAWIKCHVRYIKSVPEEVSGIRHDIWMNS